MNYWTLWWPSKKSKQTNKHQIFNLRAAVSRVCNLWSAAFYVQYFPVSFFWQEFVFGAIFFAIYFFWCCNVFWQPVFFYINFISSYFSNLGKTLFDKHFSRGLHEKVAMSKQLSKDIVTYRLNLSRGWFSENHKILAYCTVCTFFTRLTFLHAIKKWQNSSDTFSQIWGLSAILKSSFYIRLSLSQQYV